MKAAARLALAAALSALAGEARAQGYPPPQYEPQPPPRPDLGKWWRDSKIVAALKLTEAQGRRVEEIFFEYRLKLIDLRADLEREEARLQPLIEADQPDEAKVSPQIDLVLAARGRLEKANAMMMLAVRKVLSAPQWRLLENLREERERGFRGPFPPQGPPHGQPGQPPQNGPGVRHPPNAGPGGQPGAPGQPPREPGSPDERRKPFQ